MANKVLVLDAGHGYNTLGKRTAASLGTVFREWYLNDRVCDYIAQFLKDYNVTIYRTDDTDGSTDVSLTSRVRKTNEINPDLFISIHHNAGGGTGTEVYWHSYGTQEDKKVAGIIAPKLASKTGLRNRGVKQAEFAVLCCKVTAVLVEGGFMDSASDYKVITSAAGQQAYARAIADSVIQYLGLTKSSSSSNTPSSYKIRVVNCDVLNARKGPGTNFAVADTVKKGTILTIVGESGNWLHTKSGLWVSKTYTQKI